MKVKNTVSEVNDTLCNIRMKNLDELKTFLRGGARLVCNKVSFIVSKKEVKEPYWKKPIVDDIARLRKDLSQIEDWSKGRWKNIKFRRKDELRRNYSIKAKEFKMVIEELKQRMTAKAGKLKRFKARVTLYRQNKLFRCNQKALYKELGGKRSVTSDPPQTDDARKFWSEL